MNSNNVTLYVIGTELTRGIISDSHIPLITKELSELGYSVKRAIIVPDDGSIGRGLEEAVKDSDVIIVTGGLGPTSDDMTRSYIASLANVQLKKNPEAWDVLYKRIGERAKGANEIQAMIPEGFDVISNPNGTAAGFRGSFDKDGRTVTIVAMPGPPAEMRPMFFNYVKPFLASMIGNVEQQRDEYSVFLIAEAKLEEICQKCAVENVSWGTRFQAFSISLYVSGSTKENRKLFIERLRKEVGYGLIVDGDNVSACQMLTSYLKEHHLTVSCAESCTSGLIAKMLTDESGSSAWFWGGCATYDNKAKMSLLGVKEETLDSVGAVSFETAVEMAEGMRRVSGTDLAISITGIAGPDGGSEEKPVGTFYLGFAKKGSESKAVRISLSSHNRDSNRRRFAICAFILALFYEQNMDIVDIALSWMYI